MPNTRPLAAPLLLAIAAASAACGAGDEPFEGPCEPMTGVWLHQMHERPNGTCNDGDFEQAVVYGGPPRETGVVCTGSVVRSADLCALTYDNFRCVNPDGQAATMIGVLHFVEADELRGVVTFVYETNQPCTATYDVTVTMQ